MRSSSRSIRIASYMHEALARMGESAEEQEAQIALMDTGAALAETFEVLLNEFRRNPHRRYARMTPADAAGGERISPPLLLQVRAYQDAVAASKAAAPTTGYPAGPRGLARLGPRGPASAAPPPPRRLLR